MPDEMLKALQETVTANHFRRMLPPAYVQEFCDKLCLLAAVKCQEKTGGELQVECIMSDYDGTILGRASAKG